MDFFFQIDFISWVPAFLNFLVAGVLLKLVFEFIQRRNTIEKENSWIRQLLFMCLVIVCIVIVVVSLPISSEVRGQVLNLLGLALTAVIAFSSTSFVGNLMSSFMLRIVGSFRPGDFLKIGDHFGRVTERGLLHTEIQTEERSLTTLSNLYLITHPHTVVRSKGAVVSAEVSLGYDVSRHKIKDCLLEAAERAGLRDAYVQVLNLGDFSVNYKIAGLLDKVKFLLSVRSDLRCHVLDVLHENGIEIVSPNFMNQKQLSPKKEFIPKVSKHSHRDVHDEKNSVKPEEFIFDKADEAESKESIKILCVKVKDKIKELEEKIKQEGLSEEEEVKIKSRIDNLKGREAKLLEMLKKFDFED